MQKTLGFTLVEIMVAIILSVILLTVAVPSSLNLIGQHQVAGELNDVRMALAIARQHAIDRNMSTSVCAADVTGDDFSCGDNWNSQKVVFTDINSNGIYDQGTDEIIYRSAGNHSNFSLSSTRDVFVFSNNGSLVLDAIPNNQYATIKLCGAGSHEDMARALFVYTWGKVKLSADSNNDGLYEDPQAAPLSC